MAPFVDGTATRQVQIQDPATPFQLPIYVDVTEMLGTAEVTFEEELNGIDRCSFRLKYGVPWLRNFVVFGNQVKVSAGYAADFPSNVRPFFHGMIVSWEVDFTDHGRIELVVNCEDFRTVMALVTPGEIRYPSVAIVELAQTADRSFHLRDKISVSDIIGGLLDEYNIPKGDIRVSQESNYTFHLLDSLIQKKDETDWDFAYRLVTGLKRGRGGIWMDPRLWKAAKSCWFMEVDPSSGDSKVTVVPESDILADASRLRFRWQGQDFDKLDEAQWNPLASSGELLVRNLKIREDMHRARNDQQVRYKDVPTKAKGPKGRGPNSPANAPKVRGAIAAEAAKNADPKQQPGVAVPDEEVKSDLVRAGLGGASTDAKLAAARGATYDNTAQYRARRSVQTAPHNQGLDKDGTDSKSASTAQQAAAAPATPSPPAVTSKSRPVGKVKDAKTLPPNFFVPIGAQMRSFGQIATFDVPFPSIYLKCRQTTSLVIPDPVYAGSDWLLYKIKWKFGGGRLWATCEMGR